MGAADHDHHAARLHDHGHDRHHHHDNHYDNHHDDHRHGDRDHDVLTASVLLRVFSMRSMGRARAPSTAARSKIPCWPLPLRVTARSFAQPRGSAFENANQRR